MVAGPPFFQRLNPTKAKLIKIKTFNERVNRTKPDIRRSRLPIQKKNHSIRATFHTAWAMNRHSRAEILWGLHGELAIRGGPRRAIVNVKIMSLNQGGCWRSVPGRTPEGSAGD